MKQTSTDNHTKTPPKFTLIPLAKGRGYAKIDDIDLNDLRDHGYLGSWFLNDPGNGDKYVCLAHGGTNKKVSRLILNPGPGHVVRYHNNDRTDLRRSNLVLKTRKQLNEARMDKNRD